MIEFKYPMWFKNKISGTCVVRFDSLTSGTVIVGDENNEVGKTIGYNHECSEFWIEHTDSKVWENVTHLYQETVNGEKTSTPPLEMCGTSYNIEEKQNNKYKRKVPTLEIDVYDILKAFNVTNPATQHAIKKLLCAGDRGYKDKVQDLKEALASISRAIELESDNVEA